MKTKNKMLDLLKTYRLDSIFFINFFKVFSVIAIIVIIFAAYIYRNAVEVIENEFVNINENHVVRMSDISESIFREIEYIASNVALDKYVELYMMSFFSDDNREKIERVQDKILSYSSVNKYIDSIYVYSELSQRVCTTDTERSVDDFTDNSWISHYERSKNDLITVVSRKKPNGYPHVLTFIKMTGSLNMPGAIIINLNLQTYGNVIDNYTDDDIRFYIVDADGKIVYSKSENLMQSNISGDEVLEQLILKNKNGLMKQDNGSYAFSKTKSYYYGWDYISVTEVGSYSDKLINIRLLWIVIFFAALIAGVILSAMLAFATLKPFKNIMDVFDDENIEALERMPNNEVKYFAERIISVIGANNEIKEELDRKLRLYNEAQLLALQSQISPHFINNTLNIINMSIVEEAGIKCVSSKLLIALSKILKVGFETDKIIITVKEELEYTKLYAELLKRRYENLFDMIWDVNPDVYDDKIMKMCLQPLIENSVCHGMYERDFGGIIKITVHRDGEKLYVCVEDNGCGMTEQQISEVMESVLEEGLGSRHIGIKNVYMRLKIVFGANVEFKLESEQGKGTKVWFKF